MKKVLSFISMATLATGCAFAASHATPGSELISKLTKGQVKTTQEFAGPMGLQGYVVKAPNGQQNIFYTSKDGKYLFSGNIVEVSKDGKPVNLTQQYYAKYVSAVIAKTALTGIDKVKSVIDSTNAKAPVLYVLWDPNCSFCHLLFKELRPMIDSGKVQVKWVPVAIRPNSQAKTAEILAAKDNNAALALMTKDEAKFAMKTEQGGLKGLPADNAKASKADQAAYDATKSNTKFFIEHNFVGTPVILYRNKQDEAKMVQGYLPQKELVVLLDKVSNKW